MNKKNKKKCQMMTYYEFEHHYLPEKFEKRIKDAEKKREDYPQRVGEKIVNDIKKSFYL